MALPRCKRFVSALPATSSPFIVFERTGRAVGRAGGGDPGCHRPSCVEVARSRRHINVSSVSNSCFRNAITMSIILGCMRSIDFEKLSGKDNASCCTAAQQTQFYSIAYVLSGWRFVLHQPLFPGFFIVFACST